MGGDAGRLDGDRARAPAPRSAGGVELPPPLAGGKYLFVRLLGTGGFGSVWQGRLVHARLSKPVAIKLLRPELFRNPDWRSFGNDTLAARLRSPHIADIYDFVEEPDRCAIIMEFLEGRSLKEHLLEFGPLAPSSTLRVARALAEALSAAHRERVMHRDIKPGNIMVGASPEVAEDDIKIIDWGLALGVPRWGHGAGEDSGDVTSEQVESIDDRLRFAGTKEYMSPERFAGVIDPRADIWSYGCVLYECLTARRAFSDDDVVRQIAEGRVDLSALPSDTPKALRDVIEQCLRVDMTQRMRDIAGALALLDSSSERGPSLRAVDLPDHLPATPGDAKEVARAAVVSEVAVAVAKAPLVALSGPCGSGKSWIAVKVARDALALARQSKGEFQGGAGLVDLSGATDVPQVLQRLAIYVAELLRLPSEQHDVGTIRRMLERCARRGFLLVLDNADGVLRELPAILAPLRVPGLHVMVTARRSPSDAGWVVHAIDPLDAPPEQGILSETSVLSYEAVQLFVKRAKASRKQFALGPADVDAVAAICRRVGGLPRAIEVVAARARLSTPQAILAGLPQLVQPLVTAPSPDTMIRTFAWCIDSASPDERLLLERLSIFEGAFTSDSVAAVCCDERVPPAALDDLLNSLIDQSLVQGERSWEPRYRLLEMVRDHCRRRLEAPDRREELAALRRRHLERFAALVLPRADAKVDESSLSPHGFDRVNFRCEEADCDAAIRCALSDSSTIETGIDMAIEMQDEWYKRGRYQAGVVIIERLLAAWSDRGDLRHVRLLAARAKLEWLRAPWRAYDGLRAALAIQRTRLERGAVVELDEERTRLARILHNFGLYAIQLDDRAEAHRSLDEALALYRGMNNAQGVAETRLSCAVLAVVEHRLDDAVEHLDAALSALDPSDSMRISNGYFYRGRVAFLRGDLESALRWCRDALSLRMKTDEPEGVAECIRFAGEIAARCGNAADAAALFGAAQRRRDAIGVDVQATDAAIYEECLRRVRVELSRHDFDRAWDRGSGLADEEAAVVVDGLLRG
ncbi:MAG: protein kinase [Phycisphaerales bacterium]